MGRKKWKGERKRKRKEKGKWRVKYGGRKSVLKWVGRDGSEREGTTEGEKGGVMKGKRREKYSGGRRMEVRVRFKVVK